MANRTSYVPGTPNWVDLGAPDPAAAAAFYGGLFGWTAEEGPPEAGGYRMCMLGDQAVAGIGPAMGDGVWWTTYVSVADADASAAAVTAAGGTVVVAPMDVLDAGRMAVFLDPRGAAFSVWQPKAHIGAGLVNEHGALTWNELYTADASGSSAFYAAVFGWTFEPFDAESDYLLVHVAGEVVGGVQPIGGADVPAGTPEHWAVYFHVDDVDATAAAVAELGGTVTAPPFDAPGVGRVAVATDPQGAVFSLISPPDAAAG